MRRSRLSKVSDKKSKQNLLITIVGIIAILFLLIRYGIPFLGNLGYFFGQVTSIPKEVTIDDEIEVHVAPPRLDSIPKATADKELIVTGTSAKGSTVELYLNGFTEDESKTSEGGNFEFTIILTEGENIIKARAKSSDTKSEFSDSVSINFIDTAPQLTIDSPTDGQEHKGNNPITVNGTTDPDTSITVNDFTAVINFDNSYSYNLLLVEGSNEIKVIAEDLAGNTTEKIINVTYSP